MKRVLEDIFTRTSIKPADRTKIGAHEVYIADGFVEHQDLTIIQRHFGSVIKHGKEGRDEWPHGCFATLWLTPGKIATRGGISLSTDTDRAVRLTKIKEEATRELTRVVH